MMNGAEIVERHGVVLQWARGTVVSLLELVVGGPISGSWWAHPQHDEIFRVLKEATAARKWSGSVWCRESSRLSIADSCPLLVRRVDKIGPETLASVLEERTSSGAHRARTVAFRDRVPPAVLEQAAQLTEDEAIEQLPEGVLKP